MNFLVDCLLAT
ncbi:hypothetical protein AKJ16_DCAP21123 [Drosera capensis]